MESLKLCQEHKGLILSGYVVMRDAAPSNHIHLIAQSNEGKLSDLIRDINWAGIPEFTAQKILKTILETGESRSDWMLKRLDSGGVRLADKSNSKNSNYHAATVRFW